MHADPLDEVFERLADGGHAEALERISQLIREEPYHGPLFAVRALILADLERTEEARADARAAVELSPESPFVHYTSAALALQAREVHEAISAARRARELAPGYAEAAILEARARAVAGQWPQVARIAEQVLAEDPHDEEAAVLAALAREVEKDGPLDSAKWQELAGRFPLNPLARSGSGWSRLTAGQVRSARQEFEQALALHPSLEWAKEGLAVSLKARFPVYALLLRFFIWSGRFPPRTRNLMAFGGVVGYGFLRRLSERNPELKPVIIPVLVAYGLFVLLSWLADPLLNLCLMAKAETRRLLTDEAKRGAMLVGACLATALVLAAISGLTPWRGALLVAIGVGLVSLTIAALFQEEEGSRKWRRLRLMAAVALSLSLAAGVLAPGPAGTAFLLALLTVAVSTWYSRLARSGG
jgi:Flp pilus assembly protein TadD